MTKHCAENILLKLFLVFSVHYLTLMFTRKFLSNPGPAIIFVWYLHDYGQLKTDACFAHYNGFFETIIWHYTKCPDPIPGTYSTFEGGYQKVSHLDCIVQQQHANIEYTIFVRLCLVCQIKPSKRYHAKAAIKSAIKKGIILKIRGSY